ncbi:DNA-protecting protein DprA [Dysgonomonas sp. 216]|nr:DNA-processing protein DprA [Dysgonomonas sp. 216]NDW17611.1 DNA-protecting protein DprA [Dysgonomonas sp. 216]
MNQQSQLFYQIALTQIKGVGDIIARNLLDIMGSEEAVFKSGRKALMAIHNISAKIVDAILDPEVFRLAEKEMKFVEKNKLKTYFIKDNNYPLRLKDCTDAPILLYYKGNADLNNQKIVSIVGTRKSTNYGNSFCETFLQDLALKHPDVLIVSGLAYGIDIQAHRSALKAGLPTVGVLAHGLDRIYPSVHRKTAVDMLEQGGLLTEFPSNTEPDKHNFVRRNRIVAGMADAVIVVESDMKGGSLITADIANSYNKQIFSLPGRISDPYSRGCNKLILDNKAGVILSADDFMDNMNWSNTTTKTVPKQKELFLNLTEEQQKIYDVLQQSDSTHVNLLSVETEIPVSQLFFILLEMEMAGLIKPQPGGMYQLI